MTFGVAGGGRVSGSFVARLPRLASQLGPVAAQSYRLASRIANSIGAGYAVRRYEDLNDSALILICAPAHGVGPIVSALAKALECRGKTILLCEGGGDSRQLACLQSRGAAVGSIDIIPGFDGQRFVAEGDKVAVREARRLVSQLGGRVEEIMTAKLGLYAAAVSFGGALISPLMQASLLCLQEAGMPKDSALKVVEALLRSSLRAYVYAGKRSWSGPLADGDQAAIRRELEALTAWDPELAKHYREAASLGFGLFGERAGLKNLDSIKK
jgi:predicted short-subunit dehydrogenase-like oxidoreductase (DUF2520 family)